MNCIRPVPTLEELENGALCAYGLATGDGTSWKDGSRGLTTVQDYGLSMLPDQNPPEGLNAAPAMSREDAVSTLKDLGSGGLRKEGRKAVNWAALLQAILMLISQFTPKS